MLMHAEDHDNAISGAPASSFFYSRPLCKVSHSGAPRPPTSKARSPSAVQ